MLPDIDLVQLRRFLAIVEAGSFIEAAQRLNITQQALSSSIARMEASAGVRFLDRKRGGRISLTLFGRLLLARARTQIAMSERTMSEIGLLRDARGGSVTVGIGETMAGRPVATAIRRFHREQPDVQIRLIEGYTEMMIEKLIAGEVDFVAGGPSHDPAHTADLEYRHLFEIRDILAVRRKHPLAEGGPVTLEALARFTWMVPAFRGDVYDAILLAYMRAKCPPPSHFIRTDAMAVGSWLCLDDDYIITVSPDLIGTLLEFGELVPLDLAETTLVRHACVITRRDARLSPPANRLLEEIVFEAERSATGLLSPRARQDH
ncbi:LysR family transcriptional regulator [Novosphingobium sp. Gsoil 351]|uniref:LysR family transcriptional regulator n=1 Tax=Novosphingobium sp. Gsoil 351 TaxID=2675225 RepID=UPI0012B47FEF|nr:LysR family transcriptional regulator [Novosphingobium sp. Gsoil 351]QGN54479.1 LysR family transcriptional regulator [Novosphingobium sp. Gsoil 351]